MQLDDDSFDFNNRGYLQLKVTTMLTRMQPVSIESYHTLCCAFPCSVTWFERPHYINFFNLFHVLASTQGPGPWAAALLTLTGLQWLWWLAHSKPFNGSGMIPKKLPLGSQVCSRLPSNTERICALHESSHSQHWSKLGPFSNRAYDIKRSRSAYWIPAQGMENSYQFDRIFMA